MKLVVYTLTERAEINWRSEAFTYKLSARKLHRKHRLSPDFPLGERNIKNLGITVIGSLFCHRSNKCKLQA